MFINRKKYSYNSEIIIQIGTNSSCRKEKELLGPRITSYIN